MARGCPTLGCGGDPRYAAPGRGHIPECKYPREPLDVLSGSKAMIEAGEHIRKGFEDGLAMEDQNKGRTMRWAEQGPLGIRGPLGNRGPDDSQPNERVTMTDQPEEGHAVIHVQPSRFERALAELINEHSEENESGTPDFILAGYLIGCLNAFNDTVNDRAVWRGESVELPSLQKLQDGKRTVPMVMYGGNLHMRNDIGEAEIKLTPGEQIHIGRIERVIAVFEEDLDLVETTEKGIVAHPEDFSVEDGG